MERTPSVASELARAGARSGPKSVNCVFSDIPHSPGLGSLRNPAGASSLATLGQRLCLRVEVIRRRIYRVFFMERKTSGQLLQEIGSVCERFAGCQAAIAGKPAPTQKKSADTPMLSTTHQAER